MPAVGSERVFEAVSDEDAQSFCRQVLAEAEADASIPDAIKHVVTLSTDSPDQLEVFEVIVFDGCRQWSVWRSYGDFVKLHRVLSVSDPVAPLPRTPGWLVRASERKRHQRFEALRDFLRAALDTDPNLQKAELRRFLQEGDESAAATHNTQLFNASSRRLLKCVTKGSSSSISTLAGDVSSLDASLDTTSESSDRRISQETLKALPCEALLLKLHDARLGH